MGDYSELARNIQFDRSEHTVSSSDSGCLLIGVGRSAAVFKIAGEQKVIKVFFPGLEGVAAEEAHIYGLLSDSEFYPRLYDSGMNYLVIDFIEGKTFFQCLTAGIQIKKKYLDEVDEALGVARNAGLNPSDVHLRNIILKPDGHIMMIDLARFRQVKDHDQQWEDLKKVWRYYDHRYFPKKIPESLLNIAAFIYKKTWEPFLERRKAKS
ncbi:protein kinase family protein [Jeotgalibacillus terrae]|uniref:Protein kinase family protein n=1 Tax=Jeotgalibacillus terrae TaxID=587735 RepID=A0ABW5ZJX8_9BACL|nr:protein kinase family protein [Jeotgalibacillus terrae]MBM7577976.1 putative Ser/Thr protein kinase [Jeotgalibacillus terrae]